MNKVKEIAKYFILLDKNNEVFTDNLVTMNGRTFYDGNAKLNKFLQLAFNIYLAKTGSPLFAESFYAYDNGAVIPAIQENYKILLKFPVDTEGIAVNVKEFLQKVFIVFREAPLSELIELSHEDEAWLEKARFYKKEDQKMDNLSKVDEYRKQYADIIEVLEKVPAYA